MATHMKAAAGRALKVESVSNTWDFKNWMGQVSLHVEGLTSTHVQPYANHVWKFESRLFVTDEEVECHHPEWQHLEQHPEDVSSEAVRILHRMVSETTAAIRLVTVVSIF